MSVSQHICVYLSSISAYLSLSEQYLSHLFPNLILTLTNFKSTVVGLEDKQVRSYSETDTLIHKTLISCNTFYPW